MGILEDLLASAAGGGRGGMGDLGMGGRQAPAPAQGASMGPILMALMPVVLAMLAGRGGGAQQARMGGGGLGDILGQVLGGGARGGAMGGGMGGGMGDILGQILGGGRTAQAGAMGGLGGLGALLEQLQRAGYGDQARSWVGTGQNMPLPADALEQIFGRDGLSAIARQAGLSEADASRGLSELLPEVVNHVTPGGEVPDLDSLTASVQDLGRRFGLG